MDRRGRLFEILNAKGMDAALIHRPENMRYFTAFTGEGCVLLSQNGSVILTDFRYTEQAARQAPELEVIMTRADLREAEAVRALCQAKAVKTMAVETDFLTHDSYLNLEKALDGIDLKPLSGIPEEMRTIKDADEIQSICKAAAISCQALQNILEKLHPGMSEKQVQILLDYEMLSLGSEKNAFDTIAAAGMNGSLPHAVPGDHIIQPGELLTLDFGAKINGYCADMTRTLAFGKISDELRTLYQAVLDAQLMALDAVHPGAITGEIDRVAREYLDARYPGAFGHSLGHGVGLFIHEQPRVGSGSQTALVPGHVITIEPGVYIPGLGGCRIEDMAILTSEGYLNPITFPKQLIEL